MAVAMKAGSTSFYRKQFGVTYLWMLFAVFLIGLGIGKTLEWYSHTRQREKEAELLYIGQLYREAIRRYYQSSPGRRHYPESLDELLRDSRYVTPQRYLRKLYPDPVTGGAFDVIWAPEGGVQGVRSTSKALPIKRTGFDGELTGFSGAVRHAEWLFVANVSKE